MFRFLLPLAFLLALGCSTSRPAAAPASAPAPAPAAAEEGSFAGEWDLIVSDTPVGTVNSTLVLTEGADGLTGKYITDGVTTNLRTVERTDDGLRIEFYSNEYQVDIDVVLRGEPTNEVLTGTTLRSYSTTATRKM